MLQNATHLRKSAPWPPNIFDEDVSCTAPATRHASLQVFFKFPTPANVFEIAINCYKNPHVLLALWQGAESLARATQQEDPPGPQNTGNLLFSDSFLWSSFFSLSLLWLFHPLLFHLSILSEIWLPNSLPSWSGGLDICSSVVLQEECDSRRLDPAGKAWHLKTTVSDSCAKVNSDRQTCFFFRKNATLQKTENQNNKEWTLNDSNIFGHNSVPSY